IAGLWAGSVYVPAAVTAIATRSGRTAAEAARLASVGGMLLAGGTILGCLATPWLAERLGRRGALAVFFVLMFVFISVGFGYLFYTPRALGWFMLCLFFLGIGGANFAVYTLWLPEQYSTECRASAFTFATSVGRFAGAGITFLVGIGVAHYGSLGVPVAMTSMAFVVGLTLIPFGLETRGQALPE
ncbi:MAG TPA: MFS transporter, partial [Thermoanaerobaculia bacterium]|nr:MFS transporter [Thermoanaerobaculia bacterium]